MQLDIKVSEGTHSIEDDGKYRDIQDIMCTLYLLVNKQINDKERVAAAIENPDLRKIVEECVDNDTDY